MPFHQPTLRLIQPYNFLATTYTFPLEAVMSPESGGGQLRIEVTDGYLLKTSVNELLQPYQTLDYVNQSDGRWWVAGRVSVVATASSLLNGTVSFHAPMGEVLRMAIQVEPALFIDESLVGFDDTLPGQRASSVITIRQQGATTPVHLRVEPTDVFTVSEGKQANVTGVSLHLTPSFEGAHVIVSYAPRSPGYHNARLVVTTPYATQTIVLAGQTGGLLRWGFERLTRILVANVTSLFGQRSPAAFRLTPWQSYFLGVGTGLLIGSLAWANLPSKATNPLEPGTLNKPLSRSASQPVVSLDSAHTQVSQRLSLPASSSEPTQANDTLSRLPPTLPSQETNLSSPVFRTKLLPDKPHRPRKLSQLTPAKTSITDRKTRQVVSPVGKVSDLEKELNGSGYWPHNP